MAYPESGHSAVNLSILVPALNIGKPFQYGNQHSPLTFITHSAASGPDCSRHVLVGIFDKVINRLLSDLHRLDLLLL
jgi:hypothetical protein